MKHFVDIGHKYLTDHIRITKKETQEDIKKDAERLIRSKGLKRKADRL